MIHRRHPVPRVKLSYVQIIMGEISGLSFESHPLQSIIEEGSNVNCVSLQS